MINSSLDFYITETHFELDTMPSDIITTDDKYLFDCFSAGIGHFLVEISFLKLLESKPSLKFLHQMSSLFLKKVLHSDRINFEELDEDDLSNEELNSIKNSVPFIIGSEYINELWIESQHKLFLKALICEYKASNKDVRSFFISKGTDIVIPSKIYFHLVEASNSDYPFAFLATYTTKIKGKISHIPLKNALLEFKSSPGELNALISSIIEASRFSSIVKKYLDSSEIFYPIKLSNEDAYSFLKDIDILEECGIICRVPLWHNEKSIAIGFDIDEKIMFSGSYFNQFRINNFSPTLIYHGVEITLEEATQLLNQKDGLQFIKNKWVEIDHADLSALLQEYNDLSRSGSTLLDILRNKSGIGQKDQKYIVNYVFSKDDWLESLLNKSFDKINNIEIPEKFQSILREYQKDAFKWLYHMTYFGFGVCLADDMGLGKTVEVLSFLEQLRINNSDTHVLIIVPATLISNWELEIEKFDKEISWFVLRGNNEPQEGLCCAFATITSYQTALKSTYISSVNWDAIILDEAQAIKNHYTSQTRKIKSLSSTMRIAMTGTPIENSLLELWSLFDFLNPGLLGSKEEFKQLYASSIYSHTRIKELIQPFVLRRVKTDKSIISDLPEKNEIDVTINLSKEQIVLYRKVVDDMNQAIEKSPGKRKIIVISTIMKLKQICNHPSQYYGVQDYNTLDSGKFIVLKQICENIYAKREKVLVFTQFKEIIPALDSLLMSVFNKKGATIDGKTSLLDRKTIVNNFQDGHYPYMVLSLKTAGVGLNLTAAQNVIHFDRWWNPAVENQATDRVYRIGQKNTVMVYKFITANTIDEVINDMLKTKQGLADDIINNLDSSVLSKFSVEELINAARYGGRDEEEI